MYCKKKWCTAGGKDPLFGRVDGFQIGPSSSSPLKLYLWIKMFQPGSGVGGVELPGDALLGIVSSYAPGGQDFVEFVQRGDALSQQALDRQC